MGILISLSHCLWSCALLRPPFTEPQTLPSSPSLFVSRRIFSDRKKGKKKKKTKKPLSMSIFDLRGFWETSSLIFCLPIKLGLTTAKEKKHHVQPLRPAALLLICLDGAERGLAFIRFYVSGAALPSQRAPARPPHSDPCPPPNPESPSPPPPPPRAGTLLMLGP